ncbi:MAG: Thermostable carboxypeptidase 1 [Candidatus Nomurabacteria bacterium]|nr:Thermostable carboxypeptidase 1 [Candidatus Nomurabacteria bacterium]
MKTKPIDLLKERLLEIAHLETLLKLSKWDQEVMMPKNASDSRAVAVSLLSGIIHGKFLAIERDGLLNELKKEADSKSIKGKDAIIIKEVFKQIERKKKLPESFVRELSEAASKSQNAWAQARKDNNFKAFLPWLTKIVELKKKEAELVGYKDSSYDALLDEYEPGMTTKEVEAVLQDLKSFLIPYLQKIKESKVKVNTKKLLGKFSIPEQYEFNKYVSEKIGFDFNSGRLDISTHPFTESPHMQDVRITTRYKENDLMYALGSTIHETGHALYEQGLPEKHFGTPLAEYISLGIHESQSRLWENMFGKSIEFWKFFYPKVQKEFPSPYKSIKLEEFYRIINKVSPSFIRTEADEVTYNLHIIIRFEIEKEIMEGHINLKDLPTIWSAKVKEYLGVDVPDDSLGVLQDVHWSIGAFGYFPTYALGNLYSAQIFAIMKREMPNMEKKMAKGEFTEAGEWLKKNIHSLGRTYSSGELIKKVTGEKLNSSYFIEYIEKKYKDLYTL